MPTSHAATFRFTASFPQIRFGAGATREIPDVLESLGLHRPLLIGSPTHNGLLEEIDVMVSRRSAGLFNEVVMHVPGVVVAKARGVAQDTQADCTVAVGGGSAIGLAKALALALGLPIVAVPTTYAGSEMTTIFGLTEGEAKRTGRDPNVMPRAVIYDPLLLLSLPSGITGPSGMNAVAHAMEALYAGNANPIVSLMAETAIRGMARWLPRAVEHSGDVEARSETLYAALLAGMSLSAVDMGLHHKLCHTLGGTFGLPHAQTHAILLPHVAAYNLVAAPKAMLQVAEALGGHMAQEAPNLLFGLLEQTCKQVGLREIGMPEAELDRACDEAMAQRYPNPRALERQAIRNLLSNAFHGRRPVS